MKATLELINQMQADGVVSEYAIGGAVGATFYLAPAATADLDLFVRLPGASGLLVSLSPIYEYLKSGGCTEEEEYIVVGDRPVQFLPLRNALHEERFEKGFLKRMAMKPKLQARMAALSFSEKIKILEKLRDREKAIAGAGLRKSPKKPST